MMHNCWRLRGPRWRTLQDDRGNAAIEFALIAPVFVLILAGTIEIGLVIQAKFDLISVVSASANQTLSVSVDAGSASGSATSIAGLLSGDARTGTVNLNNAITAELGESGVSVSGDADDVDACYCATKTDTGLSWGSQVACGADCADGSVAGRFVEITARVPFTPMLGAYGLIGDQSLQSSAVVRLP